MRKLRPEADAELGVGVRQVPLDRVDGDEQGLGDLLVRPARGRELGDAEFGGGQLAGPAGAPGADAADLGAGTRRKIGRASCRERV